MTVYIGTQDLADAIARRLRGAGLLPDYAAIEHLVQQHQEQFIRLMLAQYRVEAASPTFVAHLRTIERTADVETVIRHHAAIVEKLRQEAESEAIA
jgi:hypothetical protein